MLPLKTLHLPHLHSVAVTFAARGGPRYESDAQRGLTHFLEHMVFRGAGELRPRELMAAFEALGGDPQAATGEDSILVELDIAPDGLEDAMQLLASVLLEPRLEDLEAERALILEERLDHTGPDGEPELDDLARGLTFQGHGLGRSILGRKRDIERCTLDDLRAWREQIVRAGNCALVVAGPVDAERVLNAAAPLAAIPAGDALIDLAPVPVQETRRVAFHTMDGPQTEIRLCFRAPGESDPRFGVLQALVDLLDGGPTSRFPVQIVDRGLAYDAHAQLFSLPDVSVIELDVAVANKKAGEATQALLEVARALGDGVGEPELERGRRRRAHLRRALRDDPSGQAEWLVHRALFGLDEDREAALAVEDAAGADDVSALAREIFVPTGLSAVVLGDPSKGAKRTARKALEGF